MEQFLGEVTFVSTKGYSFLSSEDGVGIFLHHKNILGQLIPRIGDIVLYSSRPSAIKSGAAEAYNARISKRADGTLVVIPPSIKPTEPAKSNGGAQ
jgi:cold shock CspA family protein